LNQILNAWETIAPTKSFGGMTLAQFQTVVGRSRVARDRIRDLDNQMTQAINERDDADKAALAQCQLAVNGVLADPTEGKNSALYEAMGYTRFSERKSGLHRTKGTGSKGGGDTPKT
jgi:hypothetical protein